MSERYIPKESEIPPQYIDLWDRHDRTVDQTLWDDVIVLAESEEGTPQAERGIYKDIPLATLVALAERVRGEKDPIKRYEMALEESPNGELWFDVLAGFTSDSVILRMKSQIAHYLGQEGKEGWKRGLDLGTGTGRLAKVLAEDCDSFIALDRVPAMIKEARSTDDDSVQYLVGDVTALPLKSEGFDLITSVGISASLNKEQEIAFYTNIARVLEEGGVYYDGYYSDQLWDIGYHPGGDSSKLHPETRQNLASAKGILADMIVDTVSGKNEKIERLNRRELGELFARLGLAETQVELNQYGVGFRQLEKNREKFRRMHSGYSRSGEVS